MGNSSIENRKKGTRYLKRAFLAALCVFALFLVYQHFFALEKGELRYLRNIQKEDIVRIVIEEKDVMRMLYFREPQDIEEIIDRLYDFRYVSAYAMGRHCYMELIYADGKKKYIAFDENGVWSGGNYFMGKAGYFKDLVPSLQD